MADMIKFFKGLEASLPTSGVNGALYITTDEGGIYLGTGTGIKRLGDFVQVANVASLPAKAHESCLYYCVAENILAKWNGTEWKQINKQPTAEEMKTLLGLGSMAYKSEVVEGDLSAELAEKVNAASEGNHSHSNKDVIDGITSEKVTAWDAAEGNAKGYADGLNTAMNTRVEALEAIDHEHSNKDLLDTYTQTEANLADAVAKKHAHTFVESELNKIADGDVAKWNAVVADHLTSDDKTNLENSIKEAKKAGTDANTNIETYKVANDARVLAVEEDVAEITGENGILAQAKSYSDGKLAAARTEISAEIDADVKVVNDALEAYKTSNNEALVGVKTTAEAAATKEYTDAELAKKVDKVEGKSLIADSEITRLAGVTNYDDTAIKADIAKKADTEAMTTELGKKVDKVEGYSLVSDTEIARLADVDNYDDTAVKADIAKKADTETMTTELGKKVDKVDGYSLVSDTEIARLADVDNYDDAEVRGLIGDNAKAIEDLEGYVGTFTHDTAKTVVEYINAKTDGIATSGNLEALGSRVTAVEGDVATIKGDYLKAADKTELTGLVTAEKERAEGIEGGLRTDVDAIKDDYLKGSDKTELQNQINLIMNNPDTEGVINSIEEFTNYINTHGEIAEGFRTDIDKNKEDIAAINNADTGILKQAKDYADGLAGNYAEAEHDHVVADITDFDEKVKAYGYATIGELATAKGEAEAKAAELDAALKTELQGEIDADVKVVADDLAGYKTSNDAAVAAKANSADVYAKTETYTQAEVDALIEAAHTWGSF